MKICLVGHYPPHIGGVASHTYLLSKELIKRGDDVYVLTYPHPDIHDLNGIHVETAPTVNIKGLRGFIFLISATLKLIFMTRKYEFDLVHAHFLIPPGLIAVLAGVITRKKLVVTVHGSDIFILASNPILRRLIKYILKKADYVVVVNETIRDKILELKLTGLDGKIKVTHNAVDIEKYNPHTPTNFAQEIGMSSTKLVVLFVGNLVSQKGLRYLLEAKKLLKSPAELVIVGDGPLMTDLKRMVKTEEIEDVTFTGARRDVYQIMPAADLFVLPSVSEGFPITLLEAFACGLPAVATNVGGIKELVTSEVGLIVPSADPLALAEGIDTILQNDDLKQDMGLKARKKALDYSYLEIPY